MFLKVNGDFMFVIVFRNAFYYSYAIYVVIFDFSKY